MSHNCALNYHFKSAIFMLCVWSVVRMQCMNFCEDPLASSQDRGRFYSVIHVSGVHHQRRNSVAREVEKGREKLKMCQWNVWKMQRMDKMILFRTCGSLILSNHFLGWSLQGSNCLCAFTKVSRLRTVLARFILDRDFWFHVYVGDCSEFRSSQLHCL
jgi:hypothetical protein